MKKIFSLLLTLCSLAAFGQYPVSSISITLPPNPAANTSDWAMPFVITAQAKLLQGQVPGNLMESRILVTIKSGGSKICGSFTQQNAPMSNFNTATKSWSGAAGVGLLGNGCTLKPGTYELCVQFFSSYAPVVPLSSEVCKSFTIADTKQQNYSPPQNIIPVNGKVFTEQEANMPIMFRWTPVVPKPQGDVLYKVRLIEILPGQNKTEALRTNTPIDIVEVKNNTQVSYKLSKRITGLYWEVEAESAERVQGEKPRSYGKSEATSFIISNTSSNQVINACNCIKIDQSIKCHGTFNGSPAYAIQDIITNNCNKTITSWSLTSTSGTINGGTSPQTLNTGINNPLASMLVNASQGAQVLQYIFTFSDGSQCKLNKDVILSICPPLSGCICGQWNNVNITATDITGSPVSITKNCNDTIKLASGIPFTINPNFTCTGNPGPPDNCIVSYKFDVFTSSGFQLFTNAASPYFSGVQMNDCAEVYRIVIKPICGTKPCPPCTVYFKRNCSDACLCGNWGPVIINGIKYDCNSKIPWKCNVPVKFSAGYHCKPDTCKATIDWSVSKDGNTFKTGTGTGSVGDFFTPTENGTYVITYTPICNGKKCKPCTITIIVKDCVECLCGPWGPVKYVYKKAGIEVPWKSVDCGNTTPVIAEKGHPYTFVSNLNCNPSTCKPDSNMVTVYDQNGQIIYTTPGKILENFIFEKCGKYQILFTGYCGSNKCKCVINIYVPCCECKGEPTIILTNQDGKNREIKCGAQKDIELECNNKYSLAATANCSGPDCKSKVLISISGPGINIVNAVSPVTFVPTQTGYFTATITSICGTDTCKPCKIVFVDTCICNDCDKIKVTFGNINTTATGNNGNQFNASGSFTTNVPIYGVEMEMQSYSFIANPFACTNGVTGIEQSGMFLMPGTTINGISAIQVFNETVSTSYTTNNNASKDVKLLTTSPMTGNIPFNLVLGLPGPIAGLGSNCCKITYKVCIRVKIFYDKASCKSCVFTKCFQFTN